MQLPVCSEEANLLSDQEWKKAGSLSTKEPTRTVTSISHNETFSTTENSDAIAQQG